MDTAWVMGPNGHSLAVDVVPISTTIGTGIVEGYSGIVPIVMLSYSLPVLEKLQPVMKEMRELGLTPSVHIWNRTKKHPELRVDFRIPCAGNELLARFADETMLNMFHSADPLSFAAELRLGSAGNGNRASTDAFFRQFNKMKEALVVVNEEENTFAAAYKKEISPPIGAFSVTQIGKRPPPPIELF